MRQYLTMVSGSHLWSTLVRMIAAVMALSLMSACSDFRRAIGTEKSAPDEFEVVVRPPLSLPPGFSARPSEKTISQTAATNSAQGQAAVLLQGRNAEATGYEQVFNFSAIEEDIRAKVDEETAGIRFERRLPIQVIFGGVPNVGPVLDQIQEDARIRKNKLQNKPLNSGATLAIDEVLGEPVLVE